MKYNIKDCVEDIDEDQWSSFIYNHKNGNIFQTPEFYHIYDKTALFEPLIITVNDKDGNIVGLLLAVIQKVLNNRFGILSSRAIIQGGPIVIDNQEEF